MAAAPRSAFPTNLLLFSKRHMAAETHVSVNQNNMEKQSKPRKKFGKDNIKPWQKKKKIKVNEVDIIKNLQASYSSIDSSKVQSFTDLPLSERTLRGLKENGFKEPTEIQKESLRYSLQGLDILGAAKTGSGKTLAFLIPVLEVLFCQQWTGLDGVGALIITPTRELAFQIFETLRKMGQHHDFSAGLIIGGKDLKFESKRMDRCNIVIGTPGRILQHLDENPLFDCASMQILVLDEADRCLDLGFEKSMNSIIENLPSKRQTLLFSATQTKSVRDLARLSLRDPMYVSVHENSKHATPENLRQSYVVCELQDKLAMLWSFLKNHKRKKILVFLSSCKQVKYTYEILCRLRPGVSLMALYGSLHQMRRMAIYEDFCKKKHAVLFATDVAARGLDFPSIDWVIQLDCPEDAATYVHRAGRTARFNHGGEALLVLLPSEEEAMIENLAQQRVPIDNIKINPRKLQNPQRKMEALLARDTELKASAQRAFVSYIKSVFLMKDKKVFNVHAINLESYATSLGLAMPPRVRFVQKRMKKTGTETKPETGKTESLESSEDEEEEDQQKTKHKSHDAYNFNTGASDDEEDGMFKLKRRNHDLEGTELDPEAVSATDDQHILELKSKSKTAVTKAALAKRVLKKKIVANKKTVFNEEGDVVRDAGREITSEAALRYEEDISGGIDIEQAKQALREEDVIDKQRFKERIKAKKREVKLKQKMQRQQEKEAREDASDDGSESSEGPDLSWLPDPDKIYGKKEGKSEESDVSEEAEEAEPPKPKRKKMAKASAETGLSLQEDEELALQFLRSRR